MLDEESKEAEPQDIPGDEDIYSEDPGGPFVYLRKTIAQDVRELRAWMNTQRYFPNVWFISDHGNPHLLTIPEEVPYRPEQWTLSYNSPRGEYAGHSTFTDRTEAERAEAEHRAKGDTVTLTHRPAVTDPLHYHSGAGLHGYLYADGPNVHETYEEAVSSLVETYGLGKKRAKILQRDGYLELNPQRDGNEYCEVTECRETECWKELQD